LKDGVLEQKKGELELIHAKNMKISYKNILCKEFEDLVQKYNKWRTPFADFAFSTKLPILVFLT